MWQPEQERLKELAFLLEATQQPGNNHREALDRLDSHKRNEDCNNYFAFLFALGNDYSEVVRFCFMALNASLVCVMRWCCRGCPLSRPKNFPPRQLCRTCINISLIYCLRFCTWINIASRCCVPNHMPELMQVRHTAALVLKNNILLTARSPRGAHSLHVDAPYVRQACLAMLQSANRPLRQAAGTLAAALLSFETLDRWPDLVRFFRCIQRVLRELLSSTVTVAPSRLRLCQSCANSITRRDRQAFSSENKFEEVHIL